MTVRWTANLASACVGGQAGFFTDQELAESGGIIWDPMKEQPAADTPLDPAPIPMAARSFTAEQVRAFADGRPDICFGDGFQLTRTHTATPRDPQRPTDILPGYSRVRSQRRTLGPRLPAGREDLDRRRVVLRRSLQERPLYAGHPDVRGLLPDHGLLPGRPGRHRRPRRLGLRARARGDLQAALPRSGHPRRPPPDLRGLCGGVPRRSHPHPVRRRHVYGRRPESLPRQKNRPPVDPGLPPGMRLESGRGRRRPNCFRQGFRFRLLFPGRLCLGSALPCLRPGLRGLPTANAAVRACPARPTTS